MPEKSYRFLIFLCFILILLGFLYTFPLIGHFSDGLPYNRYPGPGYEITPLTQGDHLQLFYHMWLFKASLRGDIPFFSDPYQFSIPGIKPIFSKQGFPLSFFFALFSLGGNIFSYNCLIILSFVLAGLSMYLLAFSFTKDRWSAVIAGFIFCLAPFRVSQALGGHTNGLLWFLIPLTIYFCEQSFSEKKIFYSILAGICLLSLSVMELHLIYYLVLLLGIYLILRILLTRNISSLKTIIPLAFFLLLSLAAVYYLKKQILDVSIAAAGRPLSQIRLFSPTIADIFKRTNTLSEKYIYLGFIPLFLAALGLLSLITTFATTSGKKREAAVILFAGIVLILSYALALGPNLKIIPVYSLCYRFIPFFKFPRVPGRIIILSFTALALLSAFGFRIIRRNLPLIIPAILTITLLIDYLPARPTGICLGNKDNKLYKYVSNNIEQGKILELPIWPGDSAWSSIYQYYITLSKTPMINGYSPATPSGYSDQVFSPLYNVNLGEIRKPQYDLLQKLQVKYILLHQEAFPLKVSPYPSDLSVRKLTLSPYLKLIGNEGPIWLFKLLDQPQQNVEQDFGQPSIIGKIYEAEHMRHKTGRVSPDPDASNEQALQATLAEDESGYLTYGPWRKYPTGKYKVIFRLKTDQNNSEEKIATIDIATSKGKEIIASEELRANNFRKPGIYQNFSLNYILPEPQRVEFRVNFHKATNLWADYIYIIFSDQQDPLKRIEIEQLFHIARLVPDEQASNGVALQALARLDPPDYLASGPYRQYPAGKHLASFKMKIDEFSDQEVCRLEVTTDNRKITLAAKPIDTADFRGENIYQEFQLPFSLEHTAILEFLIRYSGNVNLWVDKIDITKRE